MASSSILGRIRNAILVGIVVFISMGSSYMQTTAQKYVDGTNGSDSNNGLSVSSAWKTIQKALTNAQPGDTIYVRAGTYAENLVVSKTGTSSAPITLTNYSGETVVVNGGTGYALRNSGLISYWVIDGFTFKSTNRYTLRIGWWGEPATDHWTVRNNKIYGANYIVGSYHLWENNNIDGTGYSGAYGDAGISDGSDSHHNTYRNNTIHDFTHANARGIWTQGKTHDSLIENNTINNINAASGLGQCIDLDGAAQVEWRHTVRGNRISNCNYAGIQLENVFASTIEDNIITNTKPAGIIVISYDAGVGCLTGGESNQYGDTNGDKNCQGDLTNNLIRQNVITTTGYWGAGYGGIINWYAGGLKIWGNTIRAATGSNNGGINFQGTANQIKGGSIKNNIIFQGNGPAVCASDLKSIAEESNNLYHRTNNVKPYANGNSCGSDVSLAEYQTMSGKGLNTLTGDPAFKNTSTDFRLTSLSPAIDKGMNIGTSSDADGSARPVGANVDIGAYEYGNVVPTATSTFTFTPTATLPGTIMPSVTGTLPATQVVTNTPTGIPTTGPTNTTVPTGIFTETPTTAATVAPTALPTLPVLPVAPANTSYNLIHNGKFGNQSETNCLATGYTRKKTGSTGYLNVRVFIDGQFVKTLPTLKGGSFSFNLLTIMPSLTRNTNHLIGLQTQLGNGYWYYLLNSNTGKPGAIINCAGVIAPTPTITKTNAPTLVPTTIPTIVPTTIPTSVATVVSTSTPSRTPTTVPTGAPTDVPTNTPLPTNIPTIVPTQNEIVNIAIGKAATQSSIYGGYGANRAVDGNTDGKLTNNSVSHTNEDTHAWWQVDLGDNFAIQTLKVWNRSDCCEWRLTNFYVLVSDVPFTSSDLTSTINQPGVTSFNVSGVGGRPTELNINRTGRYIRVQISGRDSLHLAEVEVFAPPTPVSLNLMQFSSPGNTIPTATIVPTDAVVILGQTQIPELPTSTAVPTDVASPPLQTPTNSMTYTPSP